MKAITISDQPDANICYYDAETLRDDLIGLREYVRYLMGELPEDCCLNIRYMREKLFVLEWLTENAVFTDTNKNQ